MSTQQSTSKSGAIKATVKSIRIWMAVFALSAAISIVSSIFATQSVIATGVMVVAAGMIVVHCKKYDAHYEQPALVRVQEAA